jgi:hypothetical protein
MTLAETTVNCNGRCRQGTALADICHFVGRQPKNRLDLRRAFD